MNVAFCKNACAQELFQVEQLVAGCPTCTAMRGEKVLIISMIFSYYRSACGRMKVVRKR
jgi:hypothetical protein